MAASMSPKGLVHPKIIRRYMGVSRLGVNAIFGKMFPFPWDFPGICRDCWGFVRYRKIQSLYKVLNRLWYFCFDSWLLPSPPVGTKIITPRAEQRTTNIEISSTSPQPSRLPVHLPVCARARPFARPTQNKSKVRTKYTSKHITNTWNNTEKNAAWTTSTTKQATQQRTTPRTIPRTTPVSLLFPRLLPKPKLRTRAHTQPPQTTNQNDAKVIHVEQQMLQTILNCIEGLPCAWSRVCIE